MNSAAHDDEITDLEYTPVVMPLALVPGGIFGGALCDHSFELQSMRLTIDALRAENEQLKERLEETADAAFERGEYAD